jgi:hypothetical protein
VHTDAADDELLLVAHIRRDNTASTRIFGQTGFVPTDARDGEFEVWQRQPPPPELGPSPS